ncbi:homoserine kinase [Thiohalospira sp.]|uniref:homoserine kinase n=1 Tax=Thiohalospira sp. TaxID=3080549 RepID=UPI00398189AA
MSVYTRVEAKELAAFLGRYDLGELQDFRGISAGIENTNYYVTTDRQELVLTLFEQFEEEELPWFLELLDFLAGRGVPAPAPLADREGAMLQRFKDRPAALVRRLHGASVDDPGVEHCRAIGAALGHLHTAGQDFPRERPNPRGPHWWRETSRRLEGRLSDEDRQILDAELHFQSLFRFQDLPSGIVHADLFRDNALFEGTELTGIIDFYYACSDVLLYDVAITVNDWCSDTEGALDPARVDAVLTAYGEQRPFSPIERGAWPVMLRAAALRFWLSRLNDLHFPREGELTHTKDPDTFKRILERRIREERHLRRLWPGAKRA